MDSAGVFLAFIDGLGGPEMVVIFIVVLMLFGGQKLPEFARGLGKTIREFKKAAAGVEEEFKRALDEDERKKNTAALAAAPAVTSPNIAPETTPETQDYQDGYYGDSYHDGSGTDPANPDAPSAESPAATPSDTSTEGATEEKAKDSAAGSSAVTPAEPASAAGIGGQPDPASSYEDTSPAPDTTVEEEAGPGVQKKQPAVEAPPAATNPPATP